MTDLKTIPISRRDFVKLSGLASVGLALSACGLSQTPTLPSTSPPKLVPTVTPNPTTTPNPTEPLVPLMFAGVSLSIQYLEENGRTLQGSLETDQQDAQPHSTPIPPNPLETASGFAPLDFTLKAFRIRNFNYKDPLHILKLAIAQGLRQGVNGAITYFSSSAEQEQVVFGGLALFRERIESQGQVDHQINEGYPKGVVLRPRAGITVVGIGSNGDIVIAFEESISRGEKDFFDPYIRLAVISSREFADIGKSLLPTTSFSISNPAQIVYLDSTSQMKRTVRLNPIADDLMGLLYADAGELWVDQIPESLNGDGEVEDWDFHPNPVIRSTDPEPDSLPRGINTNNLAYAQITLTTPAFLGKTRSVSVWAKDKNSQDLFPSLIANYDQQANKWTWGEPTFRDIGGLLDADLGVTTSNDEYFQAGYSKLLGKEFSILYPDAAFQERFWDPSQQNRDIRISIENNQAIYIHGPIWGLDYQGSGDPGVVKAYVKRRAGKIMAVVKQIREQGGRPPLINFANELFWDNFSSEASDYNATPFYQTYGSSHIFEVYKAFYEAGISNSLDIEKDYRLGVCDFNICSMNGKTYKLYAEAKRTISQVASYLGIPDSKVQLDIFMQGNMFFDKKTRPYYMRPPPTGDQLSKAIRYFYTLGNGIKVHMTDVNLIGLSSQEEITNGYIEYLSAGLDSGLATFIYWWLLKKTQPSLENAGNYWARQGIIDLDTMKPTVEHTKLVKTLFSRIPIERLPVYPK